MAGRATKSVEAYLEELRIECPRTRRQPTAMLEALGDWHAVQPLNIEVTRA